MLRPETQQAESLTGVLSSRDSLCRRIFKAKLTMLFAIDCNSFAA